MTTTLRRVLINVSDKSGVVELAHTLAQMNCEILSMGGTAALLKEHNIPHVFFSETNLLGVDAVIMNLPPFEESISNPHHTLDDVVENIDISGVTLIREAAKNYKHIMIVVDPSDYPRFIASFTTHANTYPFRFSLAQKAFSHTAVYDSSITNYLGCQNNEQGSEFPLRYHSVYYKKHDLHPGENSHQKAAFYSDTPDNHRSLQKNWFGLGASAIPQATLIQGKSLSFNNIVDADSAWSILKELDTNEPACVIVTHANPCGVAIRYTTKDAYQAACANNSFPVEGCIIALNKTCDLQTATCIVDTSFVRIIIAPQIAPEALALFHQKPHIQLLICPYFQPTSQSRPTQSWMTKKIVGGLLLQSTDSTPTSDLQHLTCVTKRQPTVQEIKDLYFSWKIVKNVTSQAIVYSKNEMTLGIGAGQMHSIDSAWLGIKKAKQAKFSLANAVMASDVAFHVSDIIEAAAKEGITAIIQPGGSSEDAKIIEAANKADIAMIFTGVQHFRC